MVPSVLAAVLGNLKQIIRDVASHTIDRIVSGPLLQLNYVADQRRLLTLQYCHPFVLLGRIITQPLVLLLEASHYVWRGLVLLHARVQGQVHVHREAVTLVECHQMAVDFEYACALQIQPLLLGVGPIFLVKQKNHKKREKRTN